MRRVALAVALSGCSSVLGIDDFKLVDGGPSGDDAMSDAMPFCVGPDGWRICLATPPSGPRDIPAGVLDIDTDIASFCLSEQPARWKDPQAGRTQPDACFIVGTSIRIAGGLTGRGTRPLVLVAADTITITPNGFVDVASHASGPGAGVMPPCQGTGSGFNAMSGQGAGGGAGGTFLTSGGRGGTSSSQVQGGAPIPPFARPEILRAGCAGGLGGLSGGNVGGAAGQGGGAVYLVAGNQIVVDGYINASGGAGRAGQVLTGGGGGGAGGMIVLHAPMITGVGVLVANGGGGGAGSGPQGTSGDGTEPDPTLPTRAALGGDGFGRGGNGFALNIAATDGQPGSPTTAAGGGGGGGGGGYIRLNVMTGNVTASPAATIIQ